LKRVVVALVLASQLFATMILNLNVKESSQRVDLVLNFDVPFEGIIAQKRAKDKIVLLLKNVKILAPWQRKLHSKMAYQIDVHPVKEGTAIAIYTTANPRLHALKSKDGFSLKISLLPQKAAGTPQSGAGWKMPEWIYWAAGILGLLLAFFLFFRITPSRPKKTKRIVVANDSGADFRILFEKPLDEKNKIALISFKGVDYLVIIGTSNVLLGKFKEGEIQSEEDFHKAIDAQDLSSAFTQPPQEEIFTTIEEYKKKASGNL